MPIVYVAMSGGVDSSVAAALLKNLPVNKNGEGFDVVGVFMKPWSPNEEICLWKEDREDAMRAAAVLNIPLFTWDFSKQYKKQVADYMIREYKIGRTPNPDVMCNKQIKFGLFYEKAMKEGADFIATGHYVREKNGVLFTAKDKNKDQSYFLWTLNSNIVKKCFFPIGSYTKPQVREMAKKFGLPNHAKKDSQGVCFIGPLNVKNFLKKYIKSKKGKIIQSGGKEIGNHDGAYYYTIGQRHGLNIGTGAGPFYVVSKNIKNNIIYVGNKKDLLNKNAKISEINWINKKPKLPAKLHVRLRYRANLKKALLKKNGELKLENPEKAIASGQSAVFYIKDKLLGGGIIE
ncbi:MAG: tRNA 2-thiouridine(34) synthase MnmA [Candidatus Yanofskybacteria bacterium CG10_big_fil_rev_8_21_14_0_10_37_15]|uniref:tRNA-specific 2-thiouridylase MnmA n=1 Tax=Candidatus Yanofskybacteria bacterium CG10_big_fil_rev_8_21_14_0_10_37_15 TaxID=1975097 RepID=A0A2H0R656_9BACT|nr:MAG: tRNA 2-thiouridine(34) synthase MnmA [Candidatus Yanofskybacteria bacterium CG10_big_fil_rev_8_21_14_0_10_37_15]